MAVQSARTYLDVVDWVEDLRVFGKEAVQVRADALRVSRIELDDVQVILGSLVLEASEALQSAPVPRIRTKSSSPVHHSPMIQRHDVIGHFFQHELSARSTGEAHQVAQM